MKKDHTLRVCDEINCLGESINLDNGLKYLADICALFHDIGRFEQYRNYGTFSDIKSENHAALGVRILKEEGVLDYLDEKKRSLILRTISYHNRAELPQNETADCLLLTKLLRDADKIDIWRVITDHYSHKTQQPNRAIELELPDTEEVSENVMDVIRSRRIVKNEKLRTLNDLKILQTGWVFDLNFTHTYKIVRKRKYMEKLCDTISDKKIASEIYTIASGHIQLKTAAQKSSYFKS